MLKCMVSLRDFPYTSALFGLVSYNDPSKKRLQTSEIDPFFFWGGERPCSCMRCVYCFCLGRLGGVR